MTSPTLNNYRYLRVERRVYLCLRQNLTVLPWLIYRKGKSFEFSPRDFSDIATGIRRLLGWGKRLARHVLFSHDQQSTLMLPFYGHLCLEVHRGYKVFDLDRGTVTKIFKPEVDTSTIMIEIERAKRASAYSFSPEVRRWNVEERWYAEDYVNGEAMVAYTNGYPVASSDSKNFLPIYYQYVEPCIVKLITSRPSKLVNTNTYVENIIQTISTYFFKEDVDTDKSIIIFGFVDIIIKKLLSETNCHIHTVLSHGDFGPSHIIKDGPKLKIIDWEYMSCRSILFDLYSCFLEQLFFRRKVNNLIEQIDNAVLSLQKHLAAKEYILDSCHITSSSHIYRWIFYIEQIRSGMEFPDFDLGSKLRWVDAFNRFEDMYESNI
jgi:hypothetical protein